MPGESNRSFSIVGIRPTPPAQRHYLPVIKDGYLHAETLPWSIDLARCGFSSIHFVLSKAQTIVPHITTIRDEKKQAGSKRPPIFIGEGEVFYCDTCDDLEEAHRKGDVELNAFARRNYPGTYLPKNCLPKVCTIGYWDARKNQDWGLDWHRNEGIEITYLSRGSLEFAAGDSDHQLHAGNLTVTRPWQRHRVGNPKVSASRLYWLILDVNVRRPNASWEWPEWLVFSKEDLLKLTELLQHNEHPVLEGNREIEDCFDRIATVINGDTPENSSNRIKVYINELLVLLLDLMVNADLPLDPHLSSSLRTVQYFLDELGKHLDYEWTVDDMAAECGLARTRFAHYCKKLTNLPPLDYLTQIRIRTAADLLRTTEIPILEIASKCGYQSARYFSAKFRAHMACSPSAYRKGDG
jgi:AraC family L-rhamnose operon regulatory protein RhaS